MTWDELQDELYQLYEQDPSIYDYTVEYLVPGGGDWSHMEAPVKGFFINHDERTIVLTS